MSDRDGPRTRTMRAMSATASWLDRLGVWGKRGAFVVSALVVIRGAYEWGETAYHAVGEVGPHIVQFRKHVGDYEALDEDYRDHEQAHAGEHGEFHALSDTLLRALEGLKERTDSVAIRQQWLACLAGMDRDREAGRPVRDCTPLGGS